MPIKFLRSIRYKVLLYANKGIEEQSKKIDDLVKEIGILKMNGPLLITGKKIKTQQSKN